MIPITRPVTGEEEVAAAGRVILSGWTTQGPEVAAFEAEFAALTGAPHACAVSSCTTALHLALLAVGVGPGDDVVTASHSFIATANAVRHCGAWPVFADIEAGGFNLDPRAVEAAITPRTRALLVVHQLGMPCDLAAFLDIGRRHGLPVVEDAACALGSEIRIDGRWQPIGAPQGDVACFSFHPRKVISTGDGGMITTRSAAIDERCRTLRQHAMSLSADARHQAGRVQFEHYDEVAFNYRLTDIQAAVGREQLKRLPGIVERRRALAARYAQLLARLVRDQGLGLPVEPEGARSNWQSYCVRLPDGADQRAVMQSMLDAGVSTRRAVMCSHREPAYAAAPLRQSLANSEQAQDRCIMLPLYPQMSEADQAQVAAALASACAAAAAGAAAGGRPHLAVAEA